MGDPRIKFLLTEHVFTTLFPCSTETREVLGNPSPQPKRFPDTREISRGRSPCEISRVEGNIEGEGDGFPNSSRVLVEYGHSFIINFCTGSGLENPQGPSTILHYFVAKLSLMLLTRFHRALNESHPTFVELSTKAILLS